MSLCWPLARAGRQRHDREWTQGHRKSLGNENRVPPRIYCLPATRAPTVAVFCRGPTNWSQVGRWDLAEYRYDPGAWLHGRIFPRRSDLSSDGQFLCFVAHRPGARWEHGETYVALSKLPWLTALYAFGTWTRGYRFNDDGGQEDLEAPSLSIPYSLRPIPCVQFANERRRGWSEAPASPARDPVDVWDQRRDVCVQKPQPAGDRLYVESLGWAGGKLRVDQATDSLRVRYSLEGDGNLQPLDDIQWADWDHGGRLLVATRGAKLQLWHIKGVTRAVLFEEELSLEHPDPRPAPDWAQRW